MQETMTLPLSGLLVVSLEQAVAAPMCSCRLADAGARVIKIERPEGDFARGYDALAHGAEQLFRLAQPRQGIAGARSRQARRQGAARSDARQGRRVHAEPQARRGGEARLRHRAAAARLSAADRLLDLGLRRHRPLRAAQGLRHADSGRGRRRLGHRRAGGAGARRRLGLRHRRRHERLRGDPRSADRARRAAARARRSRCRCSTPWRTG